MWSSTHRSIESVHYNEHGQVEIVVITLKEFFKLTFLSFGIPNANR